MTAEQTLRSYVDAANRSALDDLVATYADVTDYRQGFLPAPLTTRPAIHEFESAMFGAFSDIHFAIDWIIADGNRASAGLRIRAVHTADMPSPGGLIVATGKAIAVESAEYIEVDDDGRITRHLRYQDTGQMMAQLQTPPAV